MTSSDTAELVANLEAMGGDLAVQVYNLASHLRLEHDPQWQAVLGHIDAATAKLRTIQKQYQVDNKPNTRLG